MANGPLVLFALATVNGLQLLEEEEQIEKALEAQEKAVVRKLPKEKVGCREFKWGPRPTHGRALKVRESFLKLMQDLISPCRCGSRVFGFEFRMSASGVQARLRASGLCMQE